ncbi:MAG: CoA-binding protein [Candidatus Lutacidiplasmatales archaeon]
MSSVDDAGMRELLGRIRTIAVVGLSDKPERDSNEVARYLKAQGYRVIPVNPSVPTVLGERSYPSLTAIPPEISIDLVDVFRRSDQVGPVVEEALARGRPAIWLQLGVENPEAVKKAGAAGVPFVENLCIMQQHRRLKVPPAVAPG